MSNLLRFLFPSLCFVLALVGCGGSSAPTTPSSPTPFNVTGNWDFEVQIPPLSNSGPIVFPTNPVEDVFGALSSSGKSVSAVLHATPLALPHCVEVDTALPFSGTTDSSGNLTLTAPLAGGVATISANVLTPATVTLPDGTIHNQPFYSGTYQVVGGTCAQSSIGLNIFSVSNITGTYTGTGTPIPPDSSILNSTITANLVEASTPDANGKYALSGTITSTGSCNATYSFTSGAVTGSTVESSYLISNTSSLPVLLGAAAPSIRPIVIAGLFNFPGCSTTYHGIINQTQ